MSGSMLKGLIGLVVGLGALLIIGIWIAGVFNTEIALSNRYDAQANVVETTLDTMRKTIMNQHNCTKEWADKFIAVVAQQASGRGGNKAVVPEGNAVAGVAVAGAGTSLQIGRESEALGIPQDLYLKLANSIEGKLAEFKRAQDVQTDVWREHKTFCQNVYRSWLIGSKIKPKPEMISSDITKDAILTKKLKDDLL